MAELVEGAEALPVPNRKRTPSELVAIYLDDLETRASVAHFKNVKSQLNRILRHVQSFEAEHILSYRRWRKSKGRSNRTINADVRALSTFLEWARVGKYIKDNPIEGIRRLPQRPCDLVKNRRAMTESEIVRFLAASERRDKECERNFPITPLFRTLIETGMRFGKCSSLTVDDLGKSAVYIRADHGKSGPARAVPLSPSLIAQLRARAHNGHVFVTPYTGTSWEQNRTTALRIFYDTLNHAQIDRADKMGRELDLHSLRWTAVSNMRRMGLDQGIVQKVVGHATSALTAAYTDFSEGDIIRIWKEKVWKPKRTRPGMIRQPSVP